MESDGRRKLRQLHCMKCGSPLVTRTVPVRPEHIPESLRDSTPSTLTRQVCSAPACDWVHYNNPIPVVAAIVDHDDGLGLPSSRGVVLVRGKGWPASWHGLVTGFLEAREDPAQGVLREVKEELGIEGRLESFLGVYPFPRLNQLILAYHIRALPEHKPLTVVLQEEELAGWKKVPLADLKPWAEGTGHAVRNFLIQQTGRSPPVDKTAFRRPKPTEQKPAEARIPSKL